MQILNSNLIYWCVIVIYIWVKILFRSNHFQKSYAFWTTLSGNFIENTCRVSLWLWSSDYWELFLFILGRGGVKFLVSALLVLKWCVHNLVFHIRLIYLNILNLKHFFYLLTSVMEIMNYAVNSPKIFFPRCREQLSGQGQ